MAEADPRADGLLSVEFAPTRTFALYRFSKGWPGGAQKGPGTLVKWSEGVPSF